jgi:hypothetical protein
LIIALQTLHWVEGVKWGFWRWWDAGVVLLRCYIGNCSHCICTLYTAKCHYRSDVSCHIASMLQATSAMSLFPISYLPHRVHYKYVGKRLLRCTWPTPLFARLTRLQPSAKQALIPIFLANTKNRVGNQIAIPLPFGYDTNYYLNDKSS